MESTADRILATAKDLVDSGGSGAVSMRKIGDALGLSAMAVYRHFPNREALLTRLAGEFFEETYEEWSRTDPPPDTVKALHGVVDALVDLALARPHRFAFMFLERREDARVFPADFHAGRSRTFGLLTRIVEDGMSSGVLRPGSPWKTGLTITATVYGLVQLRQGGRVDLPDAEFRALCHDSLEGILNGITA